MKIQQQVQPLMLLTVILSSTVSTLISFEPNAALNAAPVTAASANDFVNSIGVNTHWGYTDTQYYSNYSTVKQKLIALGVHHIRDSGSSDDVIAKLKDLAGAGIKTNYIESPASGVRPNSNYWVNPPSANNPGYNIVDFVKKVGTKAIESVEVLNEIDAFYNNYYWHPGDTAHVNNDQNSPLYWVNYATSVTQDTWTALKNNSVTTGVKVVGPSLGMTYDYSRKSPLGDLSGYVDGGQLPPLP